MLRTSKFYDDFAVGFGSVQSVDFYVVFVWNGQYWCIKKPLIDFSVRGLQ